MRPAKYRNEGPFVYGCKEQIAMHSHIRGQEYGAMLWCKRSQTNTSDQVAEAREVVGTLNNVWPSDSKLSQSVVAILL
jgi:hypothetical protein